MNSFRVMRGTGVLILVLLFWVWPAIAAPEDEYVDFPMLKKFSPVLQDDGSPKFITATAIEERFRAYSPKLQKILYNRKVKKFIVAKHAWMEDLLLAYDSFLSSLEVKAEQDTWDYENYSSMLNNLVTLRIWHAGFIDSRAAIGWVRVVAKKRWAGYQGGIHAVMFAVTGEGLFIIEPQNGQYVLLSAYPNRELIEEVYLF